MSFDSWFGTSPVFDRARWDWQGTNSEARRLSILTHTSRAFAPIDQVGIRVHGRGRVDDEGPRGGRLVNTQVLVANGGHPDRRPCSISSDERGIGYEVVSVLARYLTTPPAAGTW